MIFLILSGIFMFLSFGSVYFLYASDNTKFIFSSSLFLILSLLFSGLWINEKEEVYNQRIENANTLEELIIIILEGK